MVCLYLLTSHYRMNYIKGFFIDLIKNTELQYGLLISLLVLLITLVPLSDGLKIRNLQVRE